MREAIGGGFLFNLVIIIVSVVMLFFVGILSYSKAFRTKNRIIEIIEDYGTYDSNVEDAIKIDLKDMGYSMAKPNCPSGYSKGANYNYCIAMDDTISNGYYYKVITYVHFDIPIIGSFINIPVKGETKILGKTYS